MKALRAATGRTLAITETETKLTSAKHVCQTSTTMQ